MTSFYLKYTCLLQNNVKKTRSGYLGMLNAFNCELEKTLVSDKLIRLLKKYLTRSTFIYIMFITLKYFLHLG